MTRLLHADLTYYLRGLGFQIHNALGAGHAEADYEAALVFSLEADGVAFLQQPLYRVEYRGKQVGEYHPDVMLADTQVLLELKATPGIEPVHKAQTLSYLRVTSAELGLIMNFGGTSMQYERLPNFMADRTVHHTDTPLRPDSLFPDLSQTLIETVRSVHTTLGSGFIHQVYRRAVRIELAHRGLAATYLKELPLRFRNFEISRKPVRLFYVDEKALLATIAVRRIEASHIDKLRWAMRVTGCTLGLVANFYPTTPEFRFLRLG